MLLLFIIILSFLVLWTKMYIFVIHILLGRFRVQLDWDNLFQQLVLLK